MTKKPIGFYASLAEIISAMAIIVTLIYAVGEYNKDDVLSNSEISSLMFSRELAANHVLIENEEFAAIYYKVLNAEDITPVERLQYLAYRENFYDSWTIAWNSKRAGIMSLTEWDGWDVFYKADIKKHPIWAWHENKENYQDPAFIAYMDSLHRPREIKE